MSLFISFAINTVQALHKRMTEFGAEIQEE